jgi:Ca2+-binding EF-hand superfamily protein
MSFTQFIRLEFRSSMALLCLSQMILAGCSSPITTKAASSDKQGENSTSMQQSASGKDLIQNDTNDDVYLAEAFDEADDSLDLSGKSTPPDRRDDKDRPIPSVKMETLRADRIARMAQKLMTSLDSDKSGQLSLPEFLLPYGKKLTPDHVAKIRTMREALFVKYSGDDQQLSMDELKKMISESNGRVELLRSSQDNGRHARRFEDRYKEVFAEMDTDGNGQISQAEYEAHAHKKPMTGGPLPPVTPHP